MKFYSEVLEKFFDTEKECLKAEQAHTAAVRKKEEEERKKSEERKARAQKVEEARAELAKAKKNYDKILADFCKDYGSYHYSITSPTSLTECINEIFGF